MKLVIVPIEPMEERYSAQWIKWFRQQLTELNIDFEFVIPEGTPENTTIKQGQFLDVIGTNIFKAKQLQQLCEMAQQNALTAGTVVLFHDMWFPGLEMLGYIRDALGLKFKIAGMLHAGTWDAYDFISQHGMGRWAKELEESWLKLADKVFVATNFHKSLITDYFKGAYRDKIRVTGFPLLVNEYPFIYSNTSDGNTVVFPHRLAPEKAPEQFDKLAQYFEGRQPKLTYIKTKEKCETKQEYYETLLDSTFVVSTAKQETWGIAMQEAVLCGCIPLVPDRLSYKELYPDIFKYDMTKNPFYLGSVTLLERLFGELLEHKNTEQVQTALHDLQQAIIIRGKTAIPNIVAELLNWSN